MNILMSINYSSVSWRGIPKANVLQWLTKRGRTRARQIVVENSLVYDLSQLISVLYIKSYSDLSRVQQFEWNNRAISTLHAIFITIMSLYLIFCSDLYADDQQLGLLIYRHSTISTFVLGVSVGYFLSDIGMIFWFFPSLGGMEYVLHHLLSMSALAYAMFTGLGQLYVYMVLISETTTPGINLRWYLDVVGLKRSKAYVVNGVAIFFTWLVARIILFMYFFYHVSVHYDQIKQLPGFGRFLILVVPLIISSLNLMWFWKITMGMLKTLAKRH
ncbi:hypothetical protein Nepgr_016827 [Nepenthes gracilis]|uniref:TLC domain-containing protein n=1 Tax=Nepenthes gracilis TaxID=150966 RepID=A0AAD3XSQ4_NEPGR|nr:hypothetical protein Nepgr_016827 [Nepenthes gracilis]